MDSTEIKNLKYRSQAEILNILRNFEKLTDCSVYDVKLFVETSLGTENGTVLDLSFKVPI